MKRIALTICAVFLAGINCIAASASDTTRYLSSTMKQNWFLTASASINWWQGSDRIPAGNFTSLKGPFFGGGASLGKWLTHNVGFRLAYDVNPAKSYINGLHTNQQNEIGFLFDDMNDPIYVDQIYIHPGTNDTVSGFNYYRTSFMYHDIHFDVLISPRDLYEGYFHERTYNPVIILGMGVASVSEYPLILQSVFKGESINYELSYNFGLMNNFWINNYLDIDLTLMLYGQKWNIDSWGDEFDFEAPAGDGTFKRIRPKRVDHDFKASLGLVWYPFGRIYELPYNCEEEINELLERLQQCEDLMNNTNTNTQVIVPEVIHDTAFIVTPGEFVSYPLSIFFERDSYELMSSRDRINLKEIAKVAVEHGCKLKLRGSCDSATASAEHNQRLSENRCRKIKQELVKMGVPEDSIIYDAIGGVQELDPTKYDRRVIITLIKDN